MPYEVNKLTARLKRKLSDADELIIVRQYENESILTLSKDWGVAKDTISRILRDHNVTRRPRGRQPA